MLVEEVCEVKSVMVEMGGETLFTYLVISGLKMIEDK